MKIIVNEAAKPFRRFVKSYPNNLELELEVDPTDVRSTGVGAVLPIGPILGVYWVDGSTGEEGYASSDISDLLEKDQAPYANAARVAYRRLQEELRDRTGRFSKRLSKVLELEHVVDFLAEAPVLVALERAEELAAKKATYAKARAEREQAKKAKADAEFKARGKWEILWDEYPDGTRHKKLISAANDKEALRAFIDKIGWVGPISEPVEVICPNTRERQALIDKEGLEDGDWFETVKDALEFLEDGNGDGCDFVYHIRRPDGSYLYKSEVSPEEEDW